MPSTKTHSKTQLEEMAESAGFWWHSIDLGQGVITDGIKTREALAHEVESLQLPDLKDKTVLDIGAYDGFFSFEAERRAAKRVVALDHYAWSLDLPRSIQHWRECKERGVAPVLAEQSPYWQPSKLPGKRGYDIAHNALNSKVETVVGDFMTMDLDPLGTFDIVFFMGVLYHMENPLASLRRLASVTKDMAIIETHAIAVPGYEHLELCEFYSSNQLNWDTSNWWGPNVKALAGMCQAAGFARFEVVHISRDVNAAHPQGSTFRKVGTAVSQVLLESYFHVPLPPREPHHCRAIAHAWKGADMPGPSQG